MPLEMLWDIVSVKIVEQILPKTFFHKGNQKTSKNRVNLLIWKFTKGLQKSGSIYSRKMAESR